MKSLSIASSLLSVSLLLAAGTALASAQSSGITFEGAYQYTTDSAFGGQVLKIGYGGWGTGTVAKDATWTEDNYNLVVGCCPDNYTHARLTISGTANTKDTWVSVWTRTGECFVDGGTWNNAGKFTLGAAMIGTVSLQNGGTLNIGNTFKICNASTVVVDELSRFALNVDESGNFGDNGGIYIYKGSMSFGDASSFTIDATNYKKVEENVTIENLICACTDARTADLDDLEITVGENTFSASNEDALNQYLSELTVLGYEDYTKRFIVDNASQTVSLRLTQIPEPSAYGLLAGLGALALVGTRRRRK